MIESKVPTSAFASTYTFTYFDCISWTHHAATQHFRIDATPTWV